MLNSRALVRRLSSLVVLIVAGAARAHDADVIFVSVEPRAGDAVEELVTLTASTLALLAPVDRDADGAVSQAELDASGDALRAGFWQQALLTAASQPCERSGELAVVREGYIELRATQRCARGDLRQDFRILQVLPMNYRVIVGRQFDGERSATTAQGTLTAITLQRPAPRTGLDWAMAWAVLPRGLRIALSLDTLAALLAVFVALRTRWQRVVAAGVVGSGIVVCAVWGERDVSAAVGAAVGAIAAIAGASAVLAPVGGMVRRRPGLAVRLKWVLGAAAVLGVALRFS